MDDPPSYDHATGGSSQPKTRNNIPPQARRSMEDEARELPEGWIRQFDPNSRHHFYVDTKATPPRSIWCHPYDDVTYLRTLKVDEQERIMNMHRRPTDRDLRDESSDEEDTHHAAKGNGNNGLPDRPEHVGKFKKFGRSVKDKITNSTHESREEDRQARAEEERKMYEARVKYRNALARAANSGERQLVGKDRNGNDVYVDPPPRYAGSGMYGAGYGAPYGGAYGPGYGGYGGYGYAPPGYGYNRGLGYGYGGGYGLPLGLGVGAGLLGGALLTDAFLF